ncbi:MAG: TetR/AcrR family transcriptional regulator [Devosiaceae bacterium]|nr:TetR/AcrR family transcriptional regulator [Devosiaceae bacterium]
MPPIKSVSLSKTPASKKRPHHHGDLRVALIDAGVELVNEHGADALSIRKVAAKAGVSHAAPAHHFASLANLRTAVIARAHLQFASQMREQIKLANKDDPRAIILAALKGYMDFAFENPSLFHLMFGGFEKFDDDEEFTRASDLSYGVLSEICAPLLPGKAGEEGNQILVWSIIHGYVGIMLNRNSDQYEDADPAVLLELIFPDLPLRDPA